MSYKNFELGHKTKVVSWITLRGNLGLHYELSRGTTITNLMPSFSGVGGVLRPSSARTRGTNEHHAIRHYLRGTG